MRQNTIWFCETFVELCYDHSSKSGEFCPGRQTVWTGRFASNGFAQRHTTVPDGFCVVSGTLQGALTQGSGDLEHSIMGGKGSGMALYTNKISTVPPQVPVHRCKTCCSRFLGGLKIDQEIFSGVHWPCVT